MRFDDRQIVTLASAATQAGFFDAGALQRIAEAAYRLDEGMVSAPWSAAFDELRFAVRLSARQAARIETRWDSAQMRAEGALELEAMDSALPGVAALWRGAVIGRSQVGGGRVDRVQGGFPGLAGIDAAIDARPDPPPASGPARDAARHAEVASRLSEAEGRPDAVSGAAVAALLERAGGADALSGSGPAGTLPGAFQIHFADGVLPAKVPVRLELSAVLMLVDPAQPGFSLVELLRGTQRAQDLLAAEAGPLPPPPGFQRRVPIAGIWVAPAQWFDDADWPGASADDRLAQASAWLRPHGIAVALRP